jgi:hypothetical protein
MISIQNSYNEILSQLGEATQHRDAMSAMHRRTPTIATLEWRNEANLKLRKLRDQERRLTKQLD